MKKFKLSSQLTRHVKLTENAAKAILSKGDAYHWLFASLYKYPWHFLEELLQNAHDAYIRSNNNQSPKYVRFRLSRDALIFSHEGKAFDEQDIISISSTGNTTKKSINDYRIIGKFGIGFKSVFIITDSAQIQSANYFFELDKYQNLKFKENSGYFQTTVFRFPLNDDNAYHLTNYGLMHLDWKHLLFVHGYDVIEVQTPDVQKIIEKRRRDISKNISLISIGDNVFLVYTFRKQSVFIELAMPCRMENGQLHFLKTDNSVPLFHYFPTQESVHTGMYIHANWITTPTREHILLEVEHLQSVAMHNNTILHYLPAAISAFMSDLRRLKYLNISFWEALLACYPSSCTHPVEQIFWDSVIGLMYQKKLIPSQTGHYHVVGAYISLPPETMHLLSEHDCEVLFGRKAYLHQSLCNVIKSNISLRVKLKDIIMPDVTEVVHRIAGSAAFLQKKSRLWHIKWIHFLLNYPEYWSKEHEGKYYSIRHKPFVLSRDGQAVAPFQNGKLIVRTTGSDQNKGMIELHPLYTSDRACKEFLFKAGICPQAPEKIKKESAEHAPIIIGSLDVAHSSGLPGQMVAENVDNLDLQNPALSNITHIHYLSALVENLTMESVLFEKVDRAMPMVHKALSHYYAALIEDIERSNEHKDVIAVFFKGGMRFHIMVSAFKVFSNVFMFRKISSADITIKYYVGVDLDPEPPVIYIKHPDSMKNITEIIFG